MHARWRVARRTAVALVSMGWLAGCAPGVRSWRLDGGPVRTAHTTVVLLWVDGLDPDTLHDLLDHGRLPNLQREFVQRGAEFVNAITTLPAITYLNAASLFTGCLPDKHGVYGNRWFDRATLTFRNYDSPSTFTLANRDLRGPTVYERLADDYTVSIQCHTHRGAREGRNNVISSGLQWLLGDFEGVDGRAAGEAVSAIREWAAARRWPALITVYFPGADEIAHRVGADSPRYARAIENIDRAIGRIMRALDERGRDRPVYTFLVTDHAQVASPPDRRVDLVAWLRQNRELRITETPSKAAELAAADALAIRDAGRRLVLHLREGDWAQPASAETVWRAVNGAHTGAVPLWRAPGVALVCTQRDGEVHVRSRNGHALIRRRGRGAAARYQCATLAGVSPLLESAHEAANGWLTSDEWLRVSARWTYPYAVPQLFQFFESDRSGDVLVFAADNWVFDSHLIGGHGSALAADTRVSMFIRGPGVAPGPREMPIRLIDIAPTIVELVTGSAAQAAEPAMDGRSLTQLFSGDPTRE